MSDALLLEHHEFVSVLTFNNPPAHTWTPESLQQLQQIVGELNSNIAIVLWLLPALEINSFLLVPTCSVFIIATLLKRRLFHGFW